MSLFLAWHKFVVCFSMNNSKVHMPVQAQLPCSLFSTAINKSEQWAWNNPAGIFFFQQGRKVPHVWTPREDGGEPWDDTGFIIYSRQRFLPKSMLYERGKVLQSAHGSPPNRDTSSTEAQWFRLKHLWRTAPMGAPEGEKNAAFSKAKLITSFSLGICSIT